eukprot:TRINITY_DN10258_c0_g1_i1.p1 TRINITY_DN10258_c0_g1~~TRINITY_DN10258_c0_g1_i1.p1  ORF type:complete len:641 (+),score=170.00 TRINITY_DN10258_c0_g1_i1:400-2322(+)
MKRIQVIKNHLIGTRSIDKNPIKFTNTCGITAYIGRDGNAFDYILEGLLILQSRGYDSAGCTTISDNKEFATSKYASKGSTSDALDKLGDSGEKHKGHYIGIGHTRWATHGAKTDINAHPHLDMKGRVALVHNGVIENSDELRDELAKNGWKCISETDTEVIAQLIGYYLDKDNSTLNEAVQKVQKRLEGTWGLAILDRTNPHQIVVAKHGCPLLIGVAKDRMFIASEPSAFGKYTKQYVPLKDFEVATISADTNIDQVRIEHASPETIELTPHPHPHWTIKEIREQPTSIARAINFGGRIYDETNAKLGGLDERSDELLPIRNLLIAACGTSFHAGLFGAKIMRQLQCFDTVQVFDASEFGHFDLPPKCGMLVISQSGETQDVMKAMDIALSNNIPVFSVVNAVGSTISRRTSCGVYLNAGRENGVASTKAFTSQAAVLTLIAIWFSQNRENKDKELHLRRQLVESLLGLPVTIRSTITRTEQLCKNAAEYLLKWGGGCFILGKDYGESIAREAALKIKEIGYIQAEGYPGGSLKHGPFALIEEGTPIFLIILDDNEQHRMKTTAHEVKARKSYNIVITDLPVTPSLKEIADLIITIPSDGPLTPLVSIIPFQMIAYFLSISKGINPDKPRNLAKAVTV